jgi:hypothetical protein
MRDYGVVHSTFWTSATTHNFSGDGRLLALYLLTGPHSSSLGSFRMPDGYVMEDLGWDLKRVSKGFEELSQYGWANRCETTKWVFIRAYLKFNPPQNPNQVTALRKLAAQIPENASILEGLRAAMVEHCGRFEQGELFDEKGKGSGTVLKPFRNQNLDLNQNLDQKQNLKKESSPEQKSSGASGSANGSEPTVIKLILVGGKEYPITKKQSEEWATLYPAVDVMQELRKMRGWLDSNPTNRKTATGILRFANRWLAKEQDRSRSTSSPKLQKGATPAADDLLADRRARRVAANAERTDAK